MVHSNGAAQIRFSFGAHGMHELNNRVPTDGTRWEIFLSTRHPDRFCGPPSLQTNAERGLFPRG